MIRRRGILLKELFTVLLASLALMPLSISADDRCFSLAKTDLERLYCEVTNEGGGATLPAQADFNRNDPRVQALLLKGPARRLGLTLPPVSSQQKSSQQESLPSNLPATPPTPVNEPELPVAAGLADCELSGTRIRCSQTVYELMGNQRRSSLAAGVLGTDNQLQIDSFRGDRNEDEAVRGYLSKAYDQYILKMIRIGLAANTMSFTAFHNAFHTLESGDVDFSGRMEQTYELLKQDRKTLGVKARYHDELPESLSLCGAISSDVIVCDNVGKNWVFARTGR